jgi:hypothetical protein
MNLPKAAKSMALPSSSSQSLQTGICFQVANVDICRSFIADIMVFCYRA